MRLLVVTQFFLQHLEFPIIIQNSHTSLLAIRQLRFTLLYTWSIPNREPFLDIIPQQHSNFYISHCRSQVRFDCILCPGDQYWIHHPLILIISWVINKLFHDSINKIEFLLGAQYSPHSPWPLIIVGSSKLHLSDDSSKIITGEEEVRRHHCLA